MLDHSLSRRSNYQVTDLFERYSAKPLGLVSTENTFPSIGSPDPFPLVNVWDVVRLLRTTISWPCFMVILEGLNTNYPSVLFVIGVMAEWVWDFGIPMPVFGHWREKDLQKQRPKPTWKLMLNILATLFVAYSKTIE
jgi:hypothetical protein